jgi:proteasome accessory factor B
LVDGFRHSKENERDTMPRGNQVARQWQLLQFLGHPTGLTVDDAAQRLSRTVRTIWRDLRVLQEAGFPIYDEPAANGRRGVWKVEAAFQDRLPVPLTLAELVALLISRDLLAPAGPSPCGPAVASVFDKIKALLTPRALALVDRMRGTVGVRAPGAKLQAPSAELVPTIQAAMLDRRALQLHYYSQSRDAETVRRVDPYHLTYFNGGLYLIGHCHLRHAVRIFAIERIRSIEPLDAAFAVPEDFDAERFLARAWGILQGDLATVQVIFSPAVAPYIRERLWHSSQELRALPGGRLEMTLRVADTLEVRRWLLGFGTDAEVVAPASLRETLRGQADALSRMLAAPRKPPARMGARRRRAAVSG